MTRCCQLPCSSSMPPTAGNAVQKYWLYWLYWYKRTCFTGTKAQTLTQVESSLRERVLVGTYGGKVLVYDISRRAYGESPLESTPPPPTTFRYSLKKRKKNYISRRAFSASPV